MSSGILGQFDTQVRSYVYDQTLRRGGLPTISSIAQGLRHDAAEIKAALGRLAGAHMLVLQPDSGEILMAMPFSAVPTAFVVESQGASWFANCMWDALGIPAMLQGDADISTACGCCGSAMHLAVRAGGLQAEEGIVHFALPAARWWDNIVLT